VQLTAAFWVFATIAIFLIVGDGELPLGERPGLAAKQLKILPHKSDLPSGTGYSWCGSRSDGRGHHRRRCPLPELRNIRRSCRRAPLRNPEGIGVVFW
jgi:hypothetical protein